MPTQTPEEFAAAVAATVSVQADSGYRVWTTDLLSNRALCHQIPAAVDSFSYAKINTWGECTLTVSLDTPEDPFLLLPERKSCLWIEQRGRLLWGGIVWLAVPDLASRTLRVTAQTWHSYWDQRMITTTLFYSQVDQLDIFRAIIAYGQSKTYGNIGHIIDPRTCGVKRTVAYGPGSGQGARPDKKIAEALKQLAEDEGGFEFVDDAYLDDQGRPRKYTRLGYPKLGSSGGLAAFEYPGNVLTYTWDGAGKDAPTDLYAPGAGEGTLMMIGYARNQTALDAGYPLMEATSASDYKDETRKSALDGHAREDLAALASGRLAPTFTVRTDADPYPGSYSAGDEARFRLTSAIHRPRPDGSPGFDGRLRITGVEITPDRPGVAGVAKLTTMPTTTTGGGL